MHLCHVVPSLQEAKGGPSKSVRGLCSALARAGHRVDLLTTAPDAAISGSTEQHGSLCIRTFRREFPSGLYFSSGLRRAVAQSNANVIHHHALWLRTLHYANRAAARQRVPLIVSPRGMMSTWAWHHHHTRKQVARALIHPRAFERAAGWHATSNEEAEDVRQLGFNQPVCVAPNGVDEPAKTDVIAGTRYWRQVCPEVATRPTALFYGRFHQKKRVVELIDLWLARAPAEWLLLLVGLPEEYTPEQLERYAQQQSAGGRVRAYSGAGLPAPYGVASLFLLPSHNENFGLTVAEAMAHGVPVLVTDTTPWRMLNERQIGWCVPWEQFGEALTRATARPSDELTKLGTAARAWTLQTYSWDRAAAQLTSFYATIVAANR